jgi:hypothetical protein
MEQHKYCVRKEPGQNVMICRRRPSYIHCYVTCGMNFHSMKINKIKWGSWTVFSTIHGPMPWSWGRSTLSELMPGSSPNLLVHLIRIHDIITWFLIWPTFQGHRGQSSMLRLVGTSGYYWWPRIEYSNLVWTFIWHSLHFYPISGQSDFKYGYQAAIFENQIKSYYSWTNG